MANNALRQRSRELPVSYPHGKPDLNGKNIPDNQNIATANREKRRNGEFDYRIWGYESQALEVTLHPGEALQSEKGAMAWRHENITMTTAMSHRSGSFFGKFASIMQGMRRRWSGETAFINIYRNEGSRSALLGISPNLPSYITPVTLSRTQPALICKKGTYLASGTGVTVTSAFNRRLGTVPLTKFSLIMQRIQGEGEVFLGSHGIMLEKELPHGESLLVQVGNIVALEDTVTFGLSRIKGAANLAFGGEGLIMVRVTGPGKVWLQTRHRRTEAKAIRQALIQGE